MNLSDNFNRVSYFTELFRNFGRNNPLNLLYRPSRLFPRSPWDRINPA